MYMVNEQIDFQIKSSSLETSHSVRFSVHICPGIYPGHVCQVANIKIRSCFCN